ncbi:MAG: aromatic ring-hydroxylating dioxygenase subunit alpha [Acidimicrobiales bacterium]|nr:aromatic ring-hydroxylating dioxygenase subunit alpha [Acidimicrobiales bacterium]
MAISGLEVTSEPTLRDGTTLGDLINEDQREVSLRVLADPELYRLELERIFGRCWIAVAHESELPEPGSFVVRSIGEDSVVVTRSEDGDINVLLNVCTHRGMPLCRVGRGNAKRLRCPYHGWAFNTDGRFLAAPFEKQMYGPDMDKVALSLKTARAEVYAGIVFACWDQSAPPLVDYLGDIAWYLDIMFSRTDAGLEVVGEPQRFIIGANWKAASEQWAGDGYHAMTLHHSLTDLGLADYSKGSWAINVSTMGHNLRCTDNPKKFWGANTDGLSLEEKLRTLPPPGTTPEMLDEVMRHLSEPQLQILTDTPPSVGQIFPNLFVWNSPGLSADGTISAITRIHTMFPRGHDKMELVSWALVERDAPEDVKRKARQTSVLMTGISGFIEQDDAETWPAIQRSANGTQGQKLTMKYIAVLGEQRPEGWPDGATVYDGFSRDDPQWNWWLRYRELMTTGPAASEAW